MVKTNKTPAVVISPTVITSAPRNPLMPIQEAEYVDLETIDDTEALEADDCHFIESNTQAVTRASLNTDLIPSYSTGELVISHTAFLDSVEAAMRDVFHGETFSRPSIRCSHQIRGRKPESQFKRTQDLNDSDFSNFWQRMCFAIEITSLTRTINGEPVRLTIGGTTSLHDVNLYSKRSIQHYSIFISWKCRVCSNLMISLSDNGLLDQISCCNASEIYAASARLFSQFNYEENLRSLDSLGKVRISTNQFATLIGKLRLYSVLPIAEKKLLPSIDLGDAQTLAACRNFTNGHFGLKGNDSINGFELLNCFNDAVKNSYIHNFCSKNATCVTLAEGVCSSILGTSHEFDWFLQ